MRRLFLLALCGLVCSLSPAVAQEETADKKLSLQEAADAYKEQIRQIEKLWGEYQTSDEARQQAINAELEPMVASAKKKVEAMVEAALESYKTDPNADPDATKLLLEVVQFKIVGKGEEGGGDQLETALPIVDALVEGGADKPELPMWGLFTAVGVNDFELAEKFARIAEERGVVDPPADASESSQQVFGQARQYMAELDRYKSRWEEEQAIREKEAAADNNPRVKMELSKGDIVIELFEDQAPIATANIITLVKKGYYDGIVFHRVIPHFMAQGGDPTGTGSGGPGYSIECECFGPDARGHFRGSLSMAHAGKDTGGSQFFLCFVPTDFLDGKTPGSKHTVFGRVVEGIEVIGDLQVIDPQKGGPEPDKIIKAEVLRDRGHDYDFKKLPGR